jgi:LmbE family N-acetylglucosaminyl deacetylase
MFFQEIAMAESPRLLVFGAHPDDCDFNAGGLAALYAARGFPVKFVSLTNGDTGHYRMGGGELARRRYAETQASARVLGIEYEVLDIHNGELLPTLENRRDVIRIIRRYRPDLVFLHSPDDYHPDHRYASALVQDSAYSVIVPGVCPLTPALTRNPVFAYSNGTVTVARSYAPTLFVDIDSVLDKKLAMVRCHESQFLEWVPYSQGRLDEVPADQPGQRRWLDAFFMDWFTAFANRWRDQLVAQFGEARGRKIVAAEGLQPCPFGAPLDEAAIRRLFPFLGSA